MSPEIINAKVRRRYLERIWRKSRIQLNRSRYAKQCHFCNRLINKAKFDFHRNLISNNSYNSRQLLNSINRTLNWKAFPNISKIRLLKFVLLSQLLLLVVILIFQLYITLAVFKPASLTEVSKLILSSPNKSCKLDTIPTFLLQSCLHALIVPVTKVIN